MPNAISYIRFSSVIQGEGSSTERQEELIGRWLNENQDYQLSNLSAKDLGRSGYKGEHLKHGLGAIIDAINERKIVNGDVLLVEALDRLGRLPPLEMISLIQRIVAEGIKVITLQDRQEYTQDKLNGESGSLFILVGKVQQAHDYSKSLGERISASYVKKRVAARSGAKIKIATPFWLNSDGSLKQNEGEAVRKCIELYLKGRGARRVLLDLIKDYPVLSGVHPSTLKRWFKNRALIGDWENKGDPIKNVFTPLIDEATFYSLQSELSFKSKTMSPEVTYFLSGLVVCKNCGSKFHYRRKKHKDYVIKYGNCSTYLKRGSIHCSNNKTWPYEVLYYIFTQTYNNCVLNIVAGNEVSAQNKRLNLLNQKFDDISRRIKSIADKFGLNPNIQELADVIQNLNFERAEISKNINTIKGGLIKNSGSDASFSIKELLNMTVLMKDKIRSREILMRNGYSISIKDEVAIVEYEISECRKINKFYSVYKGLNEMESSEYELIKRSAKYNSYILRQSTRYRPDEQHNDGEVITTFCAIFRNGSVVYSQTELGLYDRLANPSLPPDKPIERPLMMKIKMVAEHK